MEKCIIAAVAADGAIGKDNDLLWHISQDLRNFKAVTGHCPVIMGRRTFESLGGRPLPGRRNIVISPTMAKTMDRIVVPGLERYPDFADVVGSLDEAYAVAETDITERMLGLGDTTFAASADSPTECRQGQVEKVEDRCFVIGGARVYADAISDVDRLYITHIDASVPDADSFFPEISPIRWSLVSESDTFTDPKSGVAFRFSEYLRKNRL